MPFKPTQEQETQGQFGQYKIPTVTGSSPAPTMYSKSAADMAAAPTPLAGMPSPQTPTAPATPVPKTPWDMANANAARQNAANEQNLTVLRNMGAFAPMAQVDKSMPFTPSRPAVADPAAVGQINYGHMDRFQKGLDSRLNGQVGTDQARQALSAMPSMKDLQALQESALANSAATGDPRDLMSMIAAKQARRVGDRQMQALNSLAANTQTYSAVERAPTDLWAQQMGSQYTNAELAANQRFNTAMSGQLNRYATDTQFAGQAAEHARTVDNNAMIDARSRQQTAMMGLPTMNRPSPFSAPTAMQAYEQAALHEYKQSGKLNTLQSRLSPPRPAPPDYLGVGGAGNTGGTGAGMPTEEAVIEARKREEARQAALRNSGQNHPPV